MNEIASHNLSNISNFFTHSLCLFRSNNTSLDPPLFSSFAFTYQVISIFTTFTGYIIGSVLRKKNVEFSWANIVSFHGTINRINTIEFTVVVFFLSFVLRYKSVSIYNFFWQQNGSCSYTVCQLYMKSKCCEQRDFFLNDSFIGYVIVLKIISFGVCSSQHMECFVFLEMFPICLLSSMWEKES